MYRYNKHFYQFLDKNESTQYVIIVYAYTHKVKERFFDN